MNSQLSEHEDGDDQSNAYNFCSDVIPTTEELFARKTSLYSVIVRIITR